MMLRAVLDSPQELHEPVSEQARACKQRDRNEHDHDLFLLNDRPVHRPSPWIGWCVLSVEGALESNCRGDHARQDGATEVDFFPIRARVRDAPQPGSRFSQARIARSCSAAPCPFTMCRQATRLATCISSVFPSQSGFAVHQDLAMVATCAESSRVTCRDRSRTLESTATARC